jgi:CelD/BcsL family acetyltransferase involved in cellulose biosynthesis
VIFDDSLPETYGHALDHLLRSASVLDFGRLPSRGPLYERLSAAARRKGLRVGTKPTDGEAIIDLPGTWAELRGTLSRSLRKNTESAERKLAGMGRLGFEVIEGPPELPGVLEECFDLETLGWKGERGSPIRSSASVLRFYTELARSAAAAGRFALYTLRLDGRLIAFEYCLRAQGRIALLKISFDPEVARQSPGHVLRFKILQRECEKGQIQAYSMGAESQWKLHWATRVEPVVKVRVYGGGLLGRVAYLAGPGTRTVLGRSDTLLRVARRIRDAVEAHRRRGRRRRSSTVR